MEKQTENTPTVDGGGDLEAIKKSVAKMTDDLFKGYNAGKASIDIYQDAPTTADKAVGKVEKAPNDDQRGEGRPKEISDVPDTDSDGARAGTYDDKISSNKDKEDEPKEAKKQAKSMDQTNDDKRFNSKPKAPPIRPFKKGEEMDSDMLKSFEAFRQFQKFEEMQKSATAPATPEATVEVPAAVVPEGMTMVPTQEYEALTKAHTIATPAVDEEAEFLKKSLAALTTQTGENSALLAKIARQPMKQKSISSINALEKSDSVTQAQNPNFSKAEVGAALDELVKANKIPVNTAIEYDFTQNIVDPAQKAIVDQYMQAQSQ